MAYKVKFVGGRCQNALSYLIESVEALTNQK